MVLVAGCTDSSASTALDAGPDRVPVVDQKGPGSPIVGGITVAEGSVLLGAAFPQPPFETLGGPAGPRIWRAVILVDGDPAEVYDAYAEQLAKASVVLVPNSPTTQCADGHGEPFEGLEGLDAGAAGFPLECSAYGERGSLYLWHTSAAGPWADHIVLTFQERSPGDPTGAVPVDLDAIGPPPGLLVDTGPPTAVPGVGDPIAPDVLNPMDGPLRVVQGSTVLAPAAPAETATGGYVAVARVTGDPGEAVDAYARQGERYGTPISSERYEADGHPVIQQWWSVAGGPKLYVTATTDDQGIWFVMIDVSND